MPVATALITTAGETAAADADSNSLQVAITHVALGAGQYTPTVGQTALADRRETVAVLVGAAQDNQLTLTASFLSSAYAGAQYDVGEIGFFIGDPGAGGVLFAVISSPTMAAPRRSSTMPNYTSTFTLALTGVPTGSVTVNFDPGAAAALIALAAHVAASDPHTQYMKESGGTFTGAVELAANAAAAMQPVPLQQLTAALSAFAAVDAQTISIGTRLLKYGTTGSLAIDSAANQVTFSTPFPTACQVVIVTPSTDRGVNVGAANYSAGIFDKTAAGFKINNDSLASAFDWIAIGN